MMPPSTTEEIEMTVAVPFSSYRPMPLATLVTLLFAGIVRAQTDPAEMSTHTYKTVDEIEIRADVYRPPGDTVRPAVLWIHGGALIMGDRKGIRSSLRDILLEAGHVVVSIDYRLAPEVKLPAIYEDIRDAYAWLRKEGPRRFRIDPEKIVVMGGSAGGFLTLSAGFLFEPRPRGLVAFYGYGDVAAEWYSRPDPFYLKQRPRVSKTDAHAEIGHGVLTSSAGKPQRGKFYLYCRQNGLWPKEVTGHDPDKSPKAFDAFCPVRNVTKSFPPTLLIHGDRDTDVPFAQSEQMEKELQRARVEHKFIRVLGAGHGLSGISGEERRKIYLKVRDFANAHTK